MVHSSPWTFGGRKPCYRLPAPRARYVVLCRGERPPALLDIANPDRHRGAVPGVPVSVDRDACSPRDLERPLVAGRYGFSDGRGTLVGACVRPWRPGDPAPGSECGPCLDGAAESDGAPPRSLAFLSLKQPCESVRDSVDFLGTLAERLASITDGTVIDLDACRRYAPEERPRRTGLAELEGFRHISYHVAEPDGGDMWLHSHGLIKYGRPELELFDVPPGGRRAASMVLFYLSQGVVDGTVLMPGHTVGPDTLPMAIQPGRNPGDHYDVPVLEICHGAFGDQARFSRVASGIESWFHQKYEIEDDVFDGGMFGGV